MCTALHLHCLEKKLVSSNANNGSNASLANWNSNNEVGNSNTNVSFRCFHNSIKKIKKIV